MSNATHSALRLTMKGIGLAGAAVMVLIALYLVPPALLMPPCLKDWTSPSSFRPRVSKMETVTFAVGGKPLKVCYGRPVGRGREVFGGIVPYGQIWRTGANEPTRLFTSVAVEVAGIPLAPGRYALYSVPGPDQWELFVSQSTFHWGNEITRSVRDREVGSAILPVQSLETPVDTFTIRPLDTPVGTTLVIEWERTRVVIPIAPTSSSGSGVN